MTSVFLQLRKIRANHLGCDLHPGAEAQLVHHAVQTHRQRLVFQLQRPRSQLRLFHPFLQGIDIGSLPVNTMKELVLFLVDICISHTVAICHSLGVRLDLSKVLLHLDLFPLQMIPLKKRVTMDQSSPNGMKGGDSPESSLQPKDPKAYPRAQPSISWTESIHSRACQQYQHL